MSKHWLETLDPILDSRLPEDVREAKLFVCTMNAAESRGHGETGRKIAGYYEGRVAELKGARKA